jgi:hypothetical protein
MAAVKDSITGLYITYFNRAPDAAGLAYWEAQAAANGASAALNSISAAFALNSVAITNYPSSMTDKQFVTQMYGYALNRGTAPTNVGPIDPAGQTYWEGRLAAITTPDDRSKVMVEFVNATLDFNANDPAFATLTAAEKQAATDAQNMLKNKVFAGQVYAANAKSNVPLDANGNPDTTSAQYVASQDVVSGVTQDPTSLTAGITKATGYAASLPASAYSVFAQQTAANEGAAATFKVNTTNVADGTAITVTLGGTANSADVTNVVTTTVTNNTATITVNLAADATTEGSETVTIATINGVAPGGSSVVSTTINDTSLTPAGSAFVLTTGIDLAPGTAGNDTISGLVDTSGATPNPTTLSAGDTVNGSTGIDTFNITTAGATPDALNNADVSNIEIFNIRATSTGATTFNAAAVAGETEVNADRGTGDLTISNMSQGVAYGLKGNSNSQLGTQSVTWDAATTSITANISGGTSPSPTTAANAVTLAGSAVTSATINSTGAANQVGTLTLPATATSATINATTGLKSSAFSATGLQNLTVNATGAVTTGAITAAGLTTVTATGTGLVDLTGAAYPGFAVTNLASTVTNINGSANTGGVMVGSSANTTAFTGGTGNDFFNMGTLVYNGIAKVNGGNGTDTLAIANDTATLFTAAAKANISGFETLQVSGTGKIFDFAGLSGITALNLDAGTSNVINNIGAATPVTVVGDQALVTLNVANATVVTNTTDTLTLTLDKTGPALTTPAISRVQVGDIKSDGLETLNIVSSGVSTNDPATNHNDDNVINSLASLSTSNVNQINVSGASDLYMVTGAINKAININATSATGNMWIDAQGNTSATGITTGGGVDNLFGGAAVDVFNAGAGNDFITGGLNGDTLNGGLGNDTYRFIAADSRGTSLTAFDKVTVTSGDIFDNTAVTLTAGTYTAGTQTTTAISDGTTLMAALTQKVNAGTVALTANAGYLVTITDSTSTANGTYLVIEDGTTAATVDATDTVIQLVGVTGTAALTAVSGDLTLGFA